MLCSSASLRPGCQVLHQLLPQLAATMPRAVQTRAAAATAATSAAGGRRGAAPATGVLVMLLETWQGMCWCAVRSLPFGSHAAQSHAQQQQCHTALLPCLSLQASGRRPWCCRGAAAAACRRCGGSRRSGLRPGRPATGAGRCVAGLGAGAFTRLELEGSWAARLRALSHPGACDTKFLLCPSSHPSAGSIAAEPPAGYPSREHRKAAALRIIRWLVQLGQAPALRGVICQELQSAALPAAAISAAAALVATPGLPREAAAVARMLQQQREVLLGSLGTVLPLPGGQDAIYEARRPLPLLGPQLERYSLLYWQLSTLLLLDAQLVEVRAGEAGEGLRAA